jgi:hypothetical protein
LDLFCKIEIWGKIQGGYILKFGVKFPPCKIEMGIKLKYQGLIEGGYLYYVNLKYGGFEIWG